MAKQSRTKNGYRLRFVLILMLLAAFSTVLLFTFFSLSPRVTELLSSNAVDRTKETVLQGVKSLDLFIDNLLTTLNYAADLLTGEPDAEEGFWRDRLLFLTASRSDINAFAFYAGDGRLLYATAGESAFTRAEVAQSDFFINAVERHGTAAYFTAPHVQSMFRGKRSYVFSISRTVEYTAGGQSLSGVLLMDVEYASLRVLVDKITLGKSGYAYLLDEKNRLVCHPYERAIDSGLDAENLNAVTQKILGITKDIKDGKERVLIISTLNKTRWRLVGAAYIEEITTLGNAFTRILSIVMAGAAMLSFACAALAVHFVTRPITLVASTMQKVTDGDLNVTIPEKGFREIRSVSSAFNMMLSRIRALMDQIVVEQEKKRLHELNALQAQINPHFLYNTLDSIIWMEERGRGKEAISMVSALARLFRIAISRGKPMISVGEELEHVRNYLIIQKIRFKDRFSYTIETENDALYESTLKLIVQPIVENCINHAINQTQAEELHIDIRAFTDTDHLYFTIRDDGVGIEAARLPVLLTQESGNSGIGLKNVHDRIVLTYGEKYGLSVESEEDFYTLVTVTLPRRGCASP